MTSDDTQTSVGDHGRGRRRAVLVLGVIISAALLVVVLRRVDLGAAWQTARHANLLLLILGVIGVNIALIPQAIRWRYLTHTVAPEVASTGGFLAVILAAQAVNSVIPARAGDVVRIAWLRRPSKIPISAATASMIADRILDVLFLAVVLAVGVGFVGAPGWVLTVSVVAGIGCVVFAVLWFFARRSRRRVHAVDVGDTPAGTGLGPRIRRALVRFIHSFALILDGRRLLRGMILTAMSWGIWAVGALVIARALDMDVNFLMILFVGALLNVGLAIPSSPGFVGTYQWLIMEGLAIFGVGADAGFAYALLLQAAWLIPQTITGFVILPRLGVSRTVSDSGVATT